MNSNYIHEHKLKSLDWSNAVLYQHKTEDKMLELLNCRVRTDEGPKFGKIGSSNPDYKPTPYICDIYLPGEPYPKSMDVQMAYISRTGMIYFQYQLESYTEIGIKSEVESKLSDEKLSECKEMGSFNACLLSKGYYARRKSWAIDRKLILKRREDSSASVIYIDPVFIDTTSGNHTVLNTIKVSDLVALDWEYGKIEGSIEK